MNHTDKHITTSEKTSHNQTTADGKENTATVVLIVLVLLLMMSWIGVLIVYLWKTGKICNKNHGQEGTIIKYLTFVSSSSLSLFLFLSLSFSLSHFSDLSR